MMRIAVLGATGMAGHVISTYLEELGYEIYRMSRSIAPSARDARIDAVEVDKVMQWIEDIKPSCVINLVGLLPKDADARPDLAVLLNSFLPRFLEQRFWGTDTKLIHLSTDCVFSGATGGYVEDSPTDGTSIYDRSKALGEVVNDKDLTFRTSIIGPDIDTNGVGLFNWFMGQSGQIRGFTKAIWNGVTTIELAKAIDEAIKQNLSGLYHPTPPVSINKHDLLHLFRAEFGKTNVEIVPYGDFVVDKTLVNTRNDFAYEVPIYSDMIHEMALWIRDHRGLYHYE